MSDYIFKYTNPSTASFVVKPYTANGPASPSVTTPYTNSSSGISAVSVNTPMVLVGKGVTDYGQVVQNNILYLAENFCNPTRPIPPMTGMLWYKSAAGANPAYPSDPTAVGLYMWDGTIWNNVLIDGKITTNININGNRIINVGDAVAATDALNTTSANGLYLSLNGGTLSGNLTLAATRTVKVSTAPAANEDVTNKIYVDSADLQLQTDINAVAADLAAATAGFGTGLGNAYLKTGGTISGDCTVVGNFAASPSSNFTLPTGTGVVDFGSRVIKNTGDPILAYDAANKVYVDTKIATELANYVPPGGGGTGTTDGVVTAASLDDITGELTLTRSNGLPTITATGAFSSKVHQHTSTEVTYNAAANLRRTVMGTSTSVINTVNDAIVLIDRALAGLAMNPSRTVVVQTVSGNTTINLGGNYTFEAWSDRTMVFMNGIKQYADTSSEASIVVTNAGLNAIVSMPAGTYDQDIIVNGIPYPVSVTITATTTYKQLYQSLKQAITTGSIPVRCYLFQESVDIMFTFVAVTPGAGQTVALSTTGTHLFPSLPSAQPQITEVGLTLAYAEVGAPGDEVSSLTFHTAPAVGSVIEVTFLGALLSV